MDYLFYVLRFGNLKNRGLLQVKLLYIILGPKKERRYFAPSSQLRGSVVMSLLIIGN